MNNEAVEAMVCASNKSERTSVERFKEMNEHELVIQDDDRKWKLPGMFL